MKFVIKSFVETDKKTKQTAKKIKTIKTWFVFAFKNNTLIFHANKIQNNYY